MNVGLSIDLFSYLEDSDPDSDNIGWMDGWINGCMPACMHACKEGRKDGWVDAWLGGQMNGCTDSVVIDSVLYVIYCFDSAFCIISGI